MASDAIHLRAPGFELTLVPERLVDSSLLACLLVSPLRGLHTPHIRVVLNLGFGDERAI